MPILPDVPKIAGVLLHRFAGLEANPQPPVIPLRLPVVLMHGFGFMGALRRRGHLHDEAVHLRLHGVRAYAPNVGPYSRIPLRCEMWKAHIERILDECRAEQVHVIAQSMGGLDARYLISRMGLHEVVASLTTISTPHHGTALASIAQQQPDLLQGWIAAVFDWMGVNSLEGCEADFKTCISELTPEFVCEQFNAATPNHPSVTYRSYAGAAGKGTDAPINPFLRVLNGMLYKREGVNDGFVAVESARWGEFLGTVPADHSAQVGLNIAPGSRFDSNEFYVSMVRTLCDEGL